ncbi:ImmA/IrrE family metallo-endopeptidase [Secundilactobacillus kimchicus]|uniref:IrrE N-terminal-like domain-containing protein n=1 Tax=Secundilactobacillus kimchicus JCM 15530 TaxID=1302272 RepID=A0A0R1HZC9_9LACO|nr:ImmA/IrrE family metallo-endopeptidase [Secundilactobacillus kimchicus]KRK49009.1 hypothetical protein FC96_GL001331 [Secundilactobacillus kimchicus JCM 15530]MBT9671793.1 ImmA/IrrE family metallo-endopeptidase [Secundilactobacillus kimchicus]
MTPFEKLISQHPKLKFKMKPMPGGLSGLTLGDEIYINPNRSSVTQYEVLLEELAHHATTVGDITAQDTQDKVKQELYARSVAHQEAVPLDGLINCFEEQLWAVDEMAEYFNVSPKYLLEAIDNYRSKNGELFKYNGYYFDLTHGVNITKI